MKPEKANTVNVLPLPEAWKHHDGNVNYVVKVTRDFVVYLDHQQDVEWETTDALDEKLDAKALGVVSNRVAALEHFPSNALASDVRRGFRISLGEAVARALEGDFKLSHEMLDNADEFIAARMNEVARRWYVRARQRITPPIRSAHGCAGG